MSSGAARPLGAWVWKALAQAGAFPDDASASAGVEWVQTHLSHVYLTGSKVYKFRKAVELGIVDFSQREERNADCLREVALNRRLAPDVYLGVAPLGGTKTKPRVGPTVETLADAPGAEHCVVMRRLPAGRDALSLLEAGQLTPAMVDAIATRIAHFHLEQTLGRPAPFSPQTWLENCTHPVDENFRVLGEAPGSRVPEGLLRMARERAAKFADEQAEVFERRRREGRAVDAHGDLHLQHVWYERDATEPIAIDCLEFNETLRRIDVASEVAFLAMDLRYRGAASLAERFLRTYARETDDFGLYAVVDYFTSYRAGVRAKVAEFAARDPAIAPAQRAGAEQSVRRHLRLAAETLAADGASAVLLVAGVVGTGKSSVAAELAARLDAVVISSDRVRKRLCGVAPTERLSTGWERGAYSKEQTDRVYAGLLERARPVLGSGRPVILDATFSRREHRDAAIRLARESDIPAFAVEVCCAPDLVRGRLDARARRGSDPSDAGPEALEPSVRSFEALDEWPAASRARVDTDQSDWSDRLANVVGRIRAAFRTGK